ncbi:SdpI family protein [Corynebacterium sp. HS2168-gen11]|uniref:SdpI family protein n=1 Tax=Corynebacterium sp. HS2168-gen11 TaxID=2974027 RepID=UPI00216ACFC2|nr:SdpI family protein [Corynebacterium sp. HS2168-gen11]MCS4535462.1 SdpI family protein [Corynebacterium sp. HS2168-gen11]
MNILGSILLVLGIAVIVIGVLAWTKHLPGNSYIGIKVKEVRKSKEQWDAAHQVAGPVWTASGLALVIAALPFFTGNYWLLLVSVIGIFAAVYFYGLGGSLATRAAGIMGQDSESEGCSSGCCSDTASEPASETPTSIDFDALRRAASQSDNTSTN